MPCRPARGLEEYRLDAMLGAGGFGITYRAYDAHLDKFVAIKEYLPLRFCHPHGGQYGGALFQCGLPGLPLGV